MNTYITINGLSTNTFYRSDNLSIPLDLDNTHYQQMLEHINTLGADVAFPDGNIPEQVQIDAANWLFNHQLKEYTRAQIRLAEPQLSDILPAKVMAPVVAEDGSITNEEIANPEIEFDNRQRAYWEDVVAATPDAVKTAWLEQNPAPKTPE